MKILQSLLFEFDEIIDCSNHYGYWITDKNKIIPMKKEGHLDTLKNIVRSEGGEVLDNYHEMLDVALHNKKWVRIVCRPIGSISVEGMIPALKRVLSILRPVVLQPNINSVYIDVYRGPSKYFYLPKEQAELKRFLNSLKS
jgi:hypothetical protein